MLARCAVRVAWGKRALRQSMGEEVQAVGSRGSESLVADRMQLGATGQSPAQQDQTGQQRQATAA